MIGKHVDLIAIALLLATIACYAHARNAFVLGIRSSRTVWATPHSRSTMTRIAFARD